MVLVTAGAVATIPCSFWLGPSVSTWTPALAPLPSDVGYIANVGWCKMLSQSPPMSVHFQLVASATSVGSTNQLVASTFNGSAEVGGKGAVTRGVVGHCKGASLHEQS